MAKPRSSEPVLEPYLHPREQTALYGHGAAENIFLEACHAGRLHHAWLIGGPQGIGKATFAYRATRFILSQPDFSSAEVREAGSLAVSPMYPAAHQVGQGSHPDCHAVEHDGEKSRKVIGIGQVRDLIQQMQSTSGHGGWRVAIIDSVDSLNNAAANALLKMLEEPPPRCIFFLISHQPGRVMATLRSRCQKLNLMPLADHDLKQAVLNVMPEAAGEIENVVPFAHGSVRGALDLVSGNSLSDRVTLASLLDALPRFDTKAMQQFCETMARRNEDSFAESVAQIAAWCHAHVVAASTYSLAGLLAGYIESFQQQARQVTVYNLDRKSFLLTRLHSLSRIMVGAA